MEYKVSVIVPVYNGEQFIENCCKQLVDQTIKDIEIILVNDGSVDESGTIIDKCAAYYKNVVALHQKNMGVSAARNNGIAHACGEYIGFVDADDQVDTDMFEILYTFAKDKNLDVVCMDPVGSKGEKTVFDNKLQWISALFKADIKTSSCNKLYRKTLLGENIFPVGKRIHEDLCAVYKALSMADSVGAVNADKYHYIHREGSGSTSPVFTDKYFDAIEIADWIYEDSINKFPELKDLAEARKAKTYLRMSKIYYLRKSPKEYKDRINLMKQYLKSLPKNKLSTYFIRNDIVRYYLYIYAKPLFLLFIKTIDKK